ncbi:hypothetical protein AGIG_G20506 [Arapaima gigas]
MRNNKYLSLLGSPEKVADRELWPNRGDLSSAVNPVSRRCPLRRCVSLSLGVWKTRGSGGCRGCHLKGEAPPSQLWWTKPRNAPPLPLPRSAGGALGFDSDNVGGSCPCRDAALGTVL